MNILNSINHCKLQLISAPIVVTVASGFQVVSRNGITFTTTGGTETASFSNYNFGTGFSSVSGTMTVKCSSNWNPAVPQYVSSQAFIYNAVASGGCWASEYGYVSQNYTGIVSTTVSGTAYSGEWIELMTPFSYAMNYFSCGAHTATNTAYCKQIVIAGSTDGTTWNYLTTINATAYTNINTGSTLNSNASAYQYHRFIVTHNIGDNYCEISAVVITC